MAVTVNLTLAPSDANLGPERLVDLCVQVLGRQLTTYVLGQDLDLWPDRGRLDDAVAVIDAFAAANRVTMAAAWLREVGAVPGHAEAPATLIRTGAAERADLVAAARAFVSALAAVRP